MLVCVSMCMCFVYVCTCVLVRRRAQVQYHRTNILNRENGKFGFQKRRRDGKRRRSIEKREFSFTAH
jgi:hypothetical protein